MTVQTYLDVFRSLIAAQDRVDEKFYEENFWNGIFAIDPTWGSDFSGCRIRTIDAAMWKDRFYECGYQFHYLLGEDKPFALSRHSYGGAQPIFEWVSATEYRRVFEHYRTFFDADTSLLSTAFDMDAPAKFYGPQGQPIMPGMNELNDE